MSLRALNLSGCLIGSLRSLARNPLPAITVLNLKGNRIDSLAGIEKLLSLERLDLRENRLIDPAELGRLTGLPEFHEVFLTRNPMVKTHTGYRVTVFNLFRNSPGYIDDILIDSSGPGYSERRQLTDRVQEHVGVPVVRPAHDDEEEAPQRVEPMDSIEPEPESAHPARAKTSVAPDDDMLRSQRRRKPARRRIVDISQAESPRRSSTQVDVADVVPITEPVIEEAPTHNGGSQVASQPSEDDVPELASDSPPSVSDPSEPVQDEPLESPEDLPDLSADSEMYKRKIHALKNDIGHGWLSALGEETRENRFVSSHHSFHEKEASSTRLHSPAVSS